MKHFCPNCNAEISTTVVEKNGQRKSKPIYFPIKNPDGSLNWKNLFHIDFVSIALIFSIVFMTIGYKADIAKCNDAIEKPCEFCKTTGCIDAVEYMTSQGKGVVIDDIQKLLNTTDS